MTRPVWLLGHNMLAGKMLVSAHGIHTPITVLDELLVLLEYKTLAEEKQGLLGKKVRLVKRKKEDLCYIPHSVEFS